MSSELAYARRFGRLVRDMKADVVGLKTTLRNVHVAQAPLWRHGEPAAPLPSPSELMHRDPDLLLGRSALLDIMHDRGPQAALLEAADRSWLSELARGDECVLPAPGDREGYLAYDDIGYWLLGLGDAMWLVELARRHGIALGKGTVVLDLGCSTGRVLRHLRALAPDVELRGVEIANHCVRWARTHLPPWIQITQGTMLPVLPFPDAYFDVIYAGSVLTHIDAFEEAWLAELRRVLKPSGIAAVTFLPVETVWPQLVSDPEHFIRTYVLRTRTRMDPPGVEPITSATFEGDAPGQRIAFTDLETPGYNAIVMHSHDWVRSRWGEIFQISEIVEHAHGNYQDGMVATA